jgi:type I restriction enzyme S subunit
MAVDALRESRHINRISTHDLGVLWSAQSYRPDITLALRRIRSWWRWAPLSQLCSNNIGPGPHPNFVSTGYPCLKTKNVIGVLVATDNVDFVEPANAVRWNHYCINSGDLILNVTGAGSIGRVGIYFGKDRPLTNQHLAKLCIDIANDAGYVCAYLASWWGERALEQGISGSTGQLNLVNEHLRQLPVVLPHEAAQRYIGDKVRQAERLRRLASHESNLADAIVAGLMEQTISEADVLHGLIDNTGTERCNAAFEAELLKRDATTRPPDLNSSKHSRVVASFLGDRLDARHYEQRFLDLKARLRELNVVSLRNVIDKVECGPFGGNAIADELYEADGLPFLRPVNLSGNRFDSSNLVRVSENRLRSQGLKIYSGENLYFARVGTPCVVMLRARASISPNVIVAQGNSYAADVGYLYCFCKSHFGIMQLEQELREGVQPTTSTDAVRNLQIVLPDKRIQKYVGDKCRRSEEFFDLSTRLTTAASALVDVLIAGEVTESTLASAKVARDRGDYVLDREVLSGLIENRTDATQAYPLFPDLDALYAAIDETVRAYTDGETS